MKGGNPKVRRILLAAVIVATAIWWFVQPLPWFGEAPPSDTPQPEAAESEAPQPDTSKPNAPKRDGLRTVVQDVVVTSHGKVVRRGSVRLAKTIARIKAGKKHRHRNDGSVFGNREGRLPKHKRGYYREYVHPTRGIRGAGPQRIVVGQGGEWYYTPDHYNSFIPLHDQAARPPP